MGKDSGQAAPSSAAKDNGSDHSEPSNDDLSKIIFGSGSQKARVSTADDSDPDNEALDQDDVADNDDADLDEDHDDETDEGEDTSRTSAQTDSDSETTEAAAEDDETQQSEDDQGAEKAAADPDDALDDEIAEARAEFTPAQQKVFDRALRKKTQRVIKLRTELETERQARTEAEAALEEARTSAPAAAATPTADAPLADVEDEQGLEKRIQDARKLRRWCLQNRDGGIIKDGEREIEISKERAGELLAESEDILEDHGPKRRQFIQTRAQLDAAAVTAYPWLKEAKGQRAVEQMLKQYPGLRRIPGVKMAVADMLMGAHFRQQQQAAKAAGTGKTGAAAARKEPPKAPATPAGGARPPRVNGTVKVSADAQRKLEQTGDDPGNAALRSIITRR